MKKNKFIATHLNALRCPEGLDALNYDGAQLISDAGKEYPVLDGVPVIISSELSLFSVSDFEQGRDTTWSSKRSTIKKLIRGIMPSISHNLKAKSNFEKIIPLLNNDAKVLIVGGSVVGPGCNLLYEQVDFDIVSSDVAYTDDVDIIFDGHDIPFKTNYFDLVVVQSVLEHVLDPQRCVQEIHRVLRSDGIVYAETPFIQQVHMKAFDFCRFTDLGHRRLFRMFTEIDRGSTGGPGMALAWSYRAFVRSFTSNVTLRSILTLFAHFTSFFLKYFDYILIDKSAASEAACEFYFIGKKSEYELSDTELIAMYKGVNW